MPDRGGIRHLQAQLRLAANALARAWASRRIRTSGRCCSAACAVFFCAYTSDGQRSASACRSRTGDRVRPTPPTEFDQRHVAPRVEHLEDPLGRCLDQMAAAVSTERAVHGCRPFGGQGPPTADTHRADLATGRSLAGVRPSSCTAASVRCRKLSESAFDIPASLHPGKQFEPEHSPSGNPPVIQSEGITL